MDLAGERSVWMSLLKLLPLQPGPGQAAENEQTNRPETTASISKKEWGFCGFQLTLLDYTP